MQAAVLLLIDPPMLDGKLQAHCQPKTAVLVLQVRGWGKQQPPPPPPPSSHYVKHIEPKNRRRSLNSGGQGWVQAVGPEKMKINKAHLNVHKKCIL
jgi:hypothetical protein